MDEPGSDGQLAPPARVIRLHPIRTLVIARDLAFRNRATTVLADLGPVAFAIAGIEPRADTLALIEHQRPHVVVLDITGCEDSPAGIVEDLLGHAPRIGIVLVAACPGARRPGLPPVLHKWGWAADMSLAVRNAYRDGNPLRMENFHVR